MSNINSENNPLNIGVQRYLVIDDTRLKVVTIFAFTDGKSAEEYQSSFFRSFFRKSDMSYLLDTPLGKSIEHVIRDLPVINAIDETISNSHFMILQDGRYKSLQRKPKYSIEELRNVVGDVVVIVPNSNDFSFGNDAIALFTTYAKAGVLNIDPNKNFHVFSKFEHVVARYKNLMNVPSQIQSGGKKKTKKDVRKIYVGRRGGKYYIRNGKKVYV